MISIAIAATANANAVGSITTPSCAANAVGVSDKAPIAVKCSPQIPSVSNPAAVAVRLTLSSPIATTIADAVSAIPMTIEAMT